MGCNCGKPKCDGHCNASPAVLQINNPSECVLFHKVEIPASMGNEITIPPDPGLYKNVLLYYEATGNAYFYSSDGIPTPISYTDYTRLTNKPSINGVMLAGDKSLSDLGIDINNATLTIKQGDTTLGTFTANASTDVEISIPEGGGGETGPSSYHDQYLSFDLGDDDRTSGMSPENFDAMAQAIANRVPISVDYYLPTDGAEITNPGFESYAYVACARDTGVYSTGSGQVRKLYLMLRAFPVSTSGHCVDQLITITRHYDQGDTVEATRNVIN